jgi:hypothetical protein
LPGRDLLVNVICLAAWTGVAVPPVLTGIGVFGFTATTYGMSAVSRSSMKCGLSLGP